MRGSRRSGSISAGIAQPPAASNGLRPGHVGMDPPTVWMGTGPTTLRRSYPRPAGGRTISEGSGAVHHVLAATTEERRVTRGGAQAAARWLRPWVRLAPRRARVTVTLFPRFRRGDAQTRVSQRIRVQERRRFCPKSSFNKMRPPTTLRVKTPGFNNKQAQHDTSSQTIMVEQQSGQQRYFEQKTQASKEKQAKHGTLI